MHVSSTELKKTDKRVKDDDDALSDIRSLYGILAGTELSQMDDDEIKNVIRTKELRERC